MFLQFLKIDLGFTCNGGTMDTISLLYGFNIYSKLKYVIGLAVKHLFVDHNFLPIIRDILIPIFAIKFITAYWMESVTQ